MGDRRHAGAVVATVVLTAAAAVLAWSIGAVVHVDGGQGDIVDPDHMVRPVRALEDLRWMLLVVSLVVGGVAVWVLYSLRRAGAVVDPRVVLPVVGIGAAIGGTYAVVTAPVVGANIGGGLAVMALPVVVVGLAVLAWRAAHRRR